ncbi:SIR2 family protein [Halodesulfovibrio sp.]|uniref:SIR2 family protein n=1 Tax=Halodesulfovibrio sp. TaxID=1912772 RepID=UPI0025C4F846|nr:SIR2 family protein [Halodesulfovibrio sp.]
MSKWEKNFVRINEQEVIEEEEDFGNFPKVEMKQHLVQLIKPWLAAIFQSEHLSLLLGSGFTTAIASKAGTSVASMQATYDNFPRADLLEKKVREYTIVAGRGEPNVEDRIRVANLLLEGLKILEHEDCSELDAAINELMSDFLKSISETEINLRDKFYEKKAVESAIAEEISEEKREEEAGEYVEKLTATDLLVSFLLSFANRTASRERLNIFTTNYERLIEHGCDLAGIRVVDRFVGCLEPVFRSSRVNVDMHYNPPGIRGEPRYLEGVVRLTKLHGSLDWKYTNGVVRRVGLPFGAPIDHPEFNSEVSDSVMIYPNSAKDRETSEYPYVELFRDYAATVCQPNSALVVYGYGFGDEHINRVIEDMLTIPSTHVVIISYDNAGGRIERFCQKVGRKQQITLLIGKHFSDIENLVENYLPQPSVDVLKFREAEIARRMFVPQKIEGTGSAA